MSLKFPRFLRSKKSIRAEELEREAIARAKLEADAKAKIEAEAKAAAARRTQRTWVGGLAALFIVLVGGLIWTSFRTDDVVPLPPTDASPLRVVSTPPVVPVPAAVPVPDPVPPSESTSVDPCEWVKPFTRNDGSYVEGYWRSKPGYSCSLVKPDEPATPPQPPRALHVGKRGGVYYISSSGKRVYVSTRVDKKATHLIPENLQ